MKGPIKLHRKGWYLILCTILISAIVPFLLFLLYKFSGGENPRGFFQDVFPGWLGINVGLTHMITLMVLIVFLRKSALTFADIGWKIWKHQSLIKEIFLGILIGLGTYVFKELVLDPIEQVITGRPVEFVIGYDLKSNINWGLLAVGVTFPFVEELTYRGFLWKAFYDKYGKAVSLIIIITIFGLLHISHSGFDFFSAGIKWSIWFGVYFWRRNLIVTTAAHSTSNLMNIFTG